MPNPTPGIIKVCRARFTLLDAAGTLLGATNNSYVTDAVTELGWAPEVNEGDTQEQKNGCDQSCLIYQQPDTVTRYNLDLTICRFEPVLISMLTGAGLLNRGTSPTVPVGVELPGDDNTQPNVAAEFWALAWNGKVAGTGTNAYVRFVWPGGKWMIGDGMALNTDFMLPHLAAKTQPNPNWGDGPYGSTADANALVVGDWGGIYLDGTPPAVTDGDFADLASAA